MSEEVSVSIDIKCDKVSKAFAIELVKSMNLAMSKITGSINSMNANLSKQTYDIATKTQSELDELRVEVAELKQWCGRLQL